MAEKNGCTTVEEGGFQVVKVQGEVDLSWSQKLRKSILDALGKSQKVAVDLSQVTYIDSSGIAALVEGFQSARGKGQHFSLVSVSQPGCGKNRASGPQMTEVSCSSAKPAPSVTRI